ncbi:GIY-YIG nuclease family protein [Pseudomonas sp. B21-015]|uniref:GIY-YIG nuclease family protein n=1 Tax=Pseudomonas sp. B21-015 TaxID=2895473 RepID=UPI00215EE3B2|nr:GIY-YIG nuclease family protein [Pseudomonas sp. B21-015]UVM52405.1 GIY-YIG nuclease family protein [Pseudomonas sp. B21-015]
MNSLLIAKGLDLARARYVRHQDHRGGKELSPHALWTAGDGRFEFYQSLQSRNVFEACDWIISCVGTPLGETLFVGVYEITHKGFAPEGSKDPVTGINVEGHHFYEMKPDPRFLDMVGKIVFDWGPGLRSWVQRADNQDKTIVEIRRTAIEPPFPGFDTFSHSINELASVPVSWRGALSAVSGVYLITCRVTGKQYVGSAYGTGGFWARWEYYRSSGHGGNVEMKLLDNHDFKVSILEVASSAASEAEIIRAEGLWKSKLMTREFGLNRN